MENCAKKKKKSSLSRTQQREHKKVLKVEPPLHLLKKWREENWVRRGAALKENCGGSSGSPERRKDRADHVSIYLETRENGKS